jgi:hypothetical protein
MRDLASLQRMIRATGRAVRLVVVLIMVTGLPLQAFSQSCALCYTQAAKSGARMIAALQDGILILVVPPMLLTIAFFTILYRKRHQCKRPDYTSARVGGW